MAPIINPGWLHGPALRERLATNLAAGNLGPPAHTAPRRVAAVAITLVPGLSGDAELLVIMRARGLRDHGGQFGLPGGRLEDGEEAVTAARRELREELAVALGTDALLGRLPAATTTSGYQIHPIVLWSETSVAEVPAPDEVAEVFRLSLAELDTAAARARDHGSLPVLGTVIFAPTGEILRHFRERAMHGRHPGEGLAEPPFAWR